MPTAMTAYTPANSSAFNNRSRYSTASIVVSSGQVLECSGLLARDRCYCRPSGRVLGENNVHFVFRLVLRDHKRILGLSVGAELQDLARQHGIFELCFFESVANRCFVERSRRLNGFRQDAHAVIRGSRIPGIHIVAGERLVVIGKFLYLRVGKLIRPPDAGEDIVGAGPKRLAGGGFRTASAIADHLMMQ